MVSAIEHHRDSNGAELGADTTAWCAPNAPLCADRQPFPQLERPAHQLGLRSPRAFITRPQLNASAYVRRTIERNNSIAASFRWSRNINDCARHPGVSPHRCTQD